MNAWERRTRAEGEREARGRWSATVKASFADEVEADLKERAAQRSCLSRDATPLCKPSLRRRAAFAAAPGRGNGQRGRGHCVWLIYYSLLALQTLAVFYGLSAMACLRSHCSK